MHDNITKLLAGIGPISNPFQSSGIRLLGAAEVSASAENLSAIRESAGSEYLHP